MSNYNIIMMKNAFFKPFVGEFYGKMESLFCKRVLILGESHYCGESCVTCGQCKLHSQCTMFTSHVIKGYLNPDSEWEGWMSTYLKFERALVNHETTSDERSRIWNSVVFYNYLQFAMNKPRQAGTRAQYRDSEGAFYSVLNQYQPDVMIVWGKRLWRYIPSDNWIEGDEYYFDGYRVDNGLYLLDGGKSVKVISIYHPSTGFDWSWWHNIIRPFIS